MSLLVRCVTYYVTFIMNWYFCRSTSSTFMRFLYFWVVCLYYFKKRYTLSRYCVEQFWITKSEYSYQQVLIPFLSYLWSLSCTKVIIPYSETNKKYLVVLLLIPYDNVKPDSLNLKIFYIVMFCFKYKRNLKSFSPLDDRVTSFML